MGNALSCVTSRKRRKKGYSDRINALRSDLVDLVNLRHGLLDSMLRHNVLTFAQCEAIRTTSSDVDAVNQLLDHVVRSTSGKQEQFLVALNKSRQKHVSNYIRSSDGVRTSIDDWPLLKSESEIRMWDWNRSTFVELVDAKNGLLDELLSSGCINCRQLQQLETSGPEAEINENLFALVRRMSVGDYRKLIRCLLATKQHVVVSLLAPDEVENVQPLSEQKKDKLMTNVSTLVDMMVTTDGLADSMFSSHCITARQREFVVSAARESERNKRLLDIVKKGSELDWDKFIECLDSTGQQHVGRVLLDEGVTVGIVSKTDCGKKNETFIVDQFMKLLRNVAEAERENLYGRVTEHVNKLRSRDVDVVAVNTRHSIGLYCACKSLAGLTYLHESYRSGLLRQIMEEMYSSLLGAVRPVRIVSVVWNTRDYLKCKQYFHKALGLSTLSELYSLYELSDKLSDEAALDEIAASTVCNYVDELPLELTEIVLSKAASQLFIALNRMTSRAEVYTLVTLSTVSFVWYNVLTNRRYTQRQLKRQFRRVCHPFRTNPKPLTTLDVAGPGSSVYGMAEHDGKLYVVCESSDVVRVFATSQAFNHIGDIRVEGLETARDLVVCPATGHLFVADWSVRCAIWRVNLSPDSKRLVEAFVENLWRPWSLWVNSTGHLLVTPFDGDALYLYDNEGDLASSTDLPDFMLARHAVETANRDTFIVCHYNRRIDDKEPEHNGVSEVDLNGSVVRTFRCQSMRDIGTRPFNRPFYMCPDGLGHVIVADRLNERVVVLTKDDLRLKRVLMGSLERSPSRLHYSAQSGLLYVAYLYSTRVSISSVRKKHSLSL